MAEEILISDIVDLGGIDKDINALLGQINKVDLAIQQVNKNPINLGNVGGLKDLKQATEQLLQATKNLNKAISDTTKVTKSASDADLKASKAKTEEAKQATEAAKAKAQEAKASVDVAKAKQIENKERENTTKVTSAEQKQIDLISNDYKILSKAYEEAALKSKNYYLTLGATHPITIQAQKDAKDLKTILDTVDQATGDYRRNVGNYAGALNNLRIQTAQLLRETPNLALSAQTFILALSNNLPLFFEAIEQVKKGNEDLVASGQKPVPVFKQIISSLFSLQSALTIGVTLLTVFGGKIIEGIKDLFGFEDAEKKAERQTKQLTQALKEQDQAFNDFKDSVEVAVNKTVAKLKELGATIYEVNNVKLTGITLNKGDAEKNAKENIALLNSYLNNLKEIKERYTEANKNIIETDIGAGAVKKEIKDFLKSSLSTVADIQISDADINNLEKVRNIANQIAQLENTKGFSKLTDSEKATFVQIKELTTAILNNVKEVKTFSDQIAIQLAEQEADRVKAVRDATRQRLEGEIETTSEISARNKKAILEQIAFDKQVKAGNFEALKQQVIAQRDFELDEEQDKIKKINAIRSLELANPENTEADKIRINAQADKEIASARLTEAEKLKIRKEAASKLFDINEEERKRNLEAEKQILVQQKQLQSEFFQNLSDINDFDVENRIQFQQQSFEAQKAIIDKEYEVQKESVKNKFLTDAEKLAIEKDYETKLLQLTRDSNKRVTEIIKSELDKQQDLRKEDIQSLERLYKSIGADNSSQYTDDVIALNNSLKKNILNYEQYLKSRKKLDEKYRRDALANSISLIEEELNRPIFAEAREQITKAETVVTYFRNKLKNAKNADDQEATARALSIAEKDFEIAKNNYDKKIDLEQQLSEFKRQLSEGDLQIFEEDFRKRMDKLAFWLEQASQLVEQIGNLGSSVHQRRLDEIQEEQDALEERYTKEREFIEQAYTNQIDRQQKLTEAEKIYNAQKHQLQQREKQERIKQAQFEKAAAISSIILNTAAAVVKALPNIALAIATGVLGAAQLAVAIATPIPRYYKGKNADDKYEGFAWVDDGGKPEAIIRESGEVEIGSNKPRITYLKSKDVVLPDAKMLAWNATKSATQKPVFVINESDGLNRDQYMLGVKRIEKAVRNIKLNITTTNPLDRWMNSDKSWSDFI